MLLEPPAPDPSSGDPGCEFHKVPAPEPVGLDGLAGKLSHQQMAALQALTAGQSVREAAKSSGVGRTTVYKWLRQDPHFRATFNAWREELLESGRARLLKGSDAAIKTLLKSIADGDARSAVALLKGIGMLSAPRPGLTDPAMMSREMELDRRQQRVDLAARSHEIASAESEHLRYLTRRADDEESHRRHLQMEEYERQEALEEKARRRQMPVDDEEEQRREERRRRLRAKRQVDAGSMGDSQKCDTDSTREGKELTT